jgi:hypothetical protein
MSMMKNACLEQVCLNDIEVSKKGSISDIAKIAGGNNSIVFLYATGIIHHEFAPEKTDCKR